VLNQWSLVASLEVPISDYVLRLTQAYAAVSSDVDAKQLEIEARKLQAAAEAKVAYYNWIRARGRAVVSGLAVALSNRHLDDAKVTFAAGLISEADVARLEGQHAQSRHLLVTTLSYERVAADMLRRLMHLESGAEFEIGVDVLGEPPAKQARTLDELQAMARKHRLDLKALRTAKRSLDNVASATRANYYPRVDAFADAIYANPNQRIFPQQEQWDFTWDVGVRLTWTINDTFQTIGQSAEAEARVDGAAEQLRALEDGVASTVTQAFYDIDVARSAIETADKREQVAKTALEARRMLFRGGKSTATEIVDSEGELIEARLQRVDAHVDLLVARARLEHAVGTRVF
jgi:outer membrane protein TolC